MDQSLTDILSHAWNPKRLEETVDYLSDKFHGFLTPQDRVMVCFPEEGEGSLGTLMKKAAQKLGCYVYHIGDDLRWKTILWLAFFHHATAIVGPPGLILGLRKLAKATSTPLYIRNVVLCGAPSELWQRQSIHSGLDCHIWGCYAPGSGPLIAGFTCEYESGIHVRDDVYFVTVHDDEGETVSDGTIGRVVLHTKDQPQIAWRTHERAALSQSVCKCGDVGQNLVAFEASLQDDNGRSSLGQQLLSWSSVLDYRASMTDSGLDLEVVIFPGEKLPKLPSCARLNLRNWNPEQDIPFFI